MSKIEKLTPEQEAMLPKSVKMGSDIGLATGPEMNEDLVRSLTDKHRVMCGFEPATFFEVYDSPFAAIKKYKDVLTTSNCLYGQHDVHWLINYAFFRFEVGLIKETEKIVHLLEIAKHIGWFWMSSDATIVTRRPKFLHMQAKASGVPVCHHDTKYAIEYVDGTGVPILNGIRIPSNLLDLFNSKEPNAEKIMNISNTELRTVFLKRLGIEKLFEILPTKVLDSNSIPGGGDYKLLSIEIGNNTRLYLSGTCPSKGESFYEAVPPTVTTVLEALNWREWQIISNDYIPPSIRT